MPAVDHNGRSDRADGRARLGIAMTPKHPTVVCEVLTPSTGLSYSAVYGGQLARLYECSGQWAVRCHHPDCGDPRDGKIISVDVVRHLAEAEADQHRAEHEHRPDAEASADRTKS